MSAHDAGEAPAATRESRFLIRLGGGFGMTEILVGAKS
jgi:hypothetical protein